MHKTLARQIERHIKNPADIAEDWAELLETISETYDGFDSDRKLIERSLDISSRELRGFISMLQATLDSTSEGILVVDDEGMITNYNKQFETIWEVPKEILKSRDSEKAIAHSLLLVNDPHALRRFIRDTNASNVGTPNHVVTFKDGRTVEISSRPQLLDGKSVGRVWSSRDVTEHLHAQEELKTKLNALERLNQAMIDRELKMVELKKRIAELEASQ